MKRGSHMANDNGVKTTAEIVSKAMKEHGWPVILVGALIWIGVQYWIGPQTELIRAITTSNENQSELISSMNQTMLTLQTGLNASQQELTKLNSQMSSAYDLMKDVPGQREEQLRLLKTLTTNSYPDEEFRERIYKDHDDASKAHGKMLDKLNHEE